MWPGRMGENASFTDGDPRATQLTRPMRWVAEGREGLDETSRVGDSLWFFQLFTTFMVSLLQVVPNSRPGPGSYLGDRPPPHYPLRAAKKQIATCGTLSNKSKGGKLEIYPYLRPFPRPCDKGRPTSSSRSRLLKASH